MENELPSQPVLTRPPTILYFYSLYFYYFFFIVEVTSSVQKLLPHYLLKVIIYLKGYYLNGNPQPLLVREEAAGTNSWKVNNFIKDFFFFCKIINLLNMNQQPRRPLKFSSDIAYHHWRCSTPHLKI